MATILIANNDPGITRLLQNVIMEAGYVPLAVRNITDARALIHTLHPYLIISDITLPIEKGLVPVSTVRNAPAQKALVTLIGATLQEHMQELKQEYDMLHGQWNRTSDQEYQKVLVDRADACLRMLMCAVRHHLRRAWLVWQPLHETLDLLPTSQSSDIKHDIPDLLKTSSWLIDLSQKLHATLTLQQDTINRLRHQSIELCQVQLPKK